MDQQAVAFARSWATRYVRLVSHGLDPTAPLVTALYKVTVKAAAPRPDPEPIAVSSDGVVKVMSITDSETGDTFTCGNDWIIQGENLKDSVPGWRVEAVHLVTASGANPIGVVIESTSATECVVQVDPVDKPEVGDYPNAVLMLDMSNTESGSLFIFLLFGSSLFSVQTCTYVSRKVILCPFSVQAGLLQTGNWWRLDTHAEPSSPPSPCSNQESR